MRPRHAAALALLTAALLAGCGGGSSDESSSEVEEVVEQLEKLKPGEIFIAGKRSPKFSGPYRFQRGGYVLRYSQEGGTPQLTVSLESRRGSKQEPYELVVDTRKASGSAQFDVRGRFYVHVTSSAESYTLRFTPKRAAG